MASNVTLGVAAWAMPAPPHPTRIPSTAINMRRFVIACSFLKLNKAS